MTNRSWQTTEEYEAAKREAAELKRKHKGAALFFPDADLWRGCVCPELRQPPALRRLDRAPGQLNSNKIRPLYPPSWPGWSSAAAAQTPLGRGPCPETDPYPPRSAAPRPPRAPPGRASSPRLKSFGGYRVCAPPVPLVPSPVEFLRPASRVILPASGVFLSAQLVAYVPPWWLSEYGGEEGKRKAGWAGECGKVERWVRGEGGRERVSKCEGGEVKRKDRRGGGEVGGWYLRLGMWYECC